MVIRLTSRKVGRDDVQLAVGHKGSIDTQDVGVLAQRHDLSLPPKLVDLVPFKHVEVDDLNGNPPIEWLIVSIVDDSRGAIACSRTMKGSC